MLSKLKINFRNYIYYKFFNSLFLGVGIGSFISQYNPIKISEIAILGILFSVLSILIAKVYTKIMFQQYFYIILLFVEFVMLFWMTFFLLFEFSYKIALLIYISRSVTFLFGDYLGRAETHLVKRKQIFSFIDINRQMGMIIGMIIAVIFYYILEKVYFISDNQSQVYYIHFFLYIIELLIIYLLVKSFRKV
jgi:hypothetical protein